MLEGLRGVRPAFEIGKHCIEQRRAHERGLLRLYLEELARRGVALPPSEDEAWLLHRQTVVWGLFIGWLICPTENYGQKITEANISRIVQAAIDLETFRAIDED